MPYMIPGLDELLERVKEKDVTKDMLLEDIHNRDANTFNLIWEDCEFQTFESLKFAFFATVSILRGALESLNVDMNPSQFRTEQTGDVAQILYEATNDQLLRRNIQIERRRYSEGAVRSGMYIYHENEIIYFISRPLKIKKSTQAGQQHLYHPGKNGAPRFTVFTNFK